MKAIPFPTAVVLNITLGIVFYLRLALCRRECNVLADSYYSRKLIDTPVEVKSLPNEIGTDTLSAPQAGPLLEGLASLFGFVALASMPGSAEEFRQAFEDWKLYFEQQDKALLAFTIQHGLIGVERHFTTEQLWLLIRWTVEHGGYVVNRRLHELLSIKEIEAIVNSWASIPYLMLRKKICDDAVEAYRMGLHTLVIPTLIPLAEGLASEIAPCDRRRTDTVTVASKAQMSYPSTDADFGEATLKILERYYYGREDFAQPATPERFNRHRILHGRVPDYGTAANSIRAFLLVDTVADMWVRMRPQASVAMS